MAHVRNNPPIPVPSHLRDTHYGGADSLGAKGYRYPHDAPAGWVDQNYAPGVATGDFYASDARDAATFEKRSDDYWERVKHRRSPRKFDPNGSAV
jgi:putative ATPase